MAKSKFEKAGTWTVALLAGASATQLWADTQYGSWDLRTAFPGAGAYTGVSNTPSSANICALNTILGVTGSAVCQSGTASAPAGAVNVLSGYDAWDATGTKIVGAMSNHGALDAQAAFPGAGYYNGTVDHLPTASQIADGRSILGVTGNNTGTFASHAPSHASRDAGISVNPSLAVLATSAQLKVGAEASTYAGSNLPTTGGYSYRDVPDSNKDDDGLSTMSCKQPSRPTTDCGKTQATIAARIADCVVQNPTASSWDGATQCNGGQGAWKLVTRSGAGNEVWQDQRTGLLWSSRVSSSAKWCQASGNTELAAVTFLKAYQTSSGTPITGSGTISSIGGGSSSLGETITITFTSSTAYTVTGTGGASGCQGGTAGPGLTSTAGTSSTYSKSNTCSFTLTQGSTPFAANDVIQLKSIKVADYSCSPGAASGLQPASPVSYCAEAAGLNAPAGENWGSGTYFAAKGLMGKTSTPAVSWRLPTLNDYRLAYSNGLANVLPFTGGVWTSTVYSDDRRHAWVFAYTAPMSTFSDNLSVQCVGR